MATKNQAWHAVHTVVDTEEDIQKCLNCKRKACNNCLEKPDKFQKTPKESLSENELKYHMILNKTDHEFLKYYPVLNTDKEIGEAIGRKQSSVYNIRIKLGFPIPRSLSREERQALVDKWTVK